MNIRENIELQNTTYVKGRFHVFLRFVYFHNISLKLNRLEFRQERGFLSSTRTGTSGCQRLELREQTLRSLLTVHQLHDRVVVVELDFLILQLLLLVPVFERRVGLWRSLEKVKALD